MTPSGGFLPDLRDGLDRCRLRDTGVLIGVSGGADSVALLRGLLILAGEFGLTVHAAHLNHRLRGAQSDADADWVDQLCRTHRVPVEIGAADVSPTSSGGGLEEAARQARHRFLDQAAANAGCGNIATAHTADDQIETVLHHLFRGTGMSGIRGIPAVRTTAAGLRLVRPLLKVRRSAITRFLAEIGQDCRTDPTNADVSLTRNWLRHTLLPSLRGRLGSHVDGSILRLADQAVEVEQTLTWLAGRLLDRAVLDAQAASVRLEAGPFVDQPLHLVREAFRLLWQRQQWPRQEMGFGDWDRVASVAVAGGDVTLPGGIRVRQKPAGLLILEKTDR